MTLNDVRARIPIEDSELVPPPGLFLHPSRLHGQAHVARVLVHGLRLIAATGFVDETAKLWAAVYIHDIARQHDGHCTRHGADAWARLATLPDVEALLARGGVRQDDHAAIETAVTSHCRGELPKDHPHWRLTSLLKDADGLDRVRLGDLDPRYLRNPEATSMVAFAGELFDRTAPWPAGDDYFVRLWPEVLDLAAEGGPRAPRQ
jgi:hypothetical protein